MKRAHPRRGIAAVAVAGVVLAACSGGEGEPTPTSPLRASDMSGPTGETGPEPTGEEATPVVPAGGRSYRYLFGGIDARLTLTGRTGDLEVANGSGADLQAPGLYSLDAITGRRLEGEVIGAEPIGDGQTATFQVSFPPGFDPAGSGFIGLVFGEEDFGGMLAG